MSNVEETETPMDTNENSVRKFVNFGKKLKETMSVCAENHPLWNFCGGVRVCVLVCERGKLWQQTAVSSTGLFIVYFGSFLCLHYAFKGKMTMFLFIIYRMHPLQKVRPPTTKITRILMLKSRQIAANGSTSCLNKRRSFLISCLRWVLVRTQNLL